MKNTLRILHLDYDDLHNPYAGGGQANATFQINKRLTERNFITVLTGSYPGAKNNMVNGIYYRRVGIGFLGPTVSILSYWLVIPIYSFFMQNKIDLIIEYFTAPIGPSVVPWVVSKPVIGYATFLDAENMYQKYGVPFHLLANILIQRYRYFVALTKSSKSLLLEKNPQAEIKIIPRGVEREILDSKTSDKRYVLCLGRIDIYGKGIDLILKVWKTMVIDRTGYKLVIAGNGKTKDVQKMKEMIKALGLASSTKIIGRVDGRKKIELLSKCSVVVNGSRYGYFGNVSLEAISVGKPLVCFDIDGFDWLPKGICIKVRPFAIDDLATKMTRILRSSKQRRAIGKEARRFAQKYTWENIAEMTENYYLKVRESI
jgi:glycogen(starch) synthase